MQPPLPIELVERIVAEPSLRHSDLAACCLTCRGMLHAARPHLYSRTELYVTDSSWPRRTHKWYSTVQANPHLAALVRCIRIRPVHLDPETADVVDVPGATLRGISEAILMPCTMLENLAGVCTILDPPTLLPFTHSLCLISEVPLDEQGYQLLRLLPHLRHLSIDAGDSANPVNLHPGRPTPAFRLQTLEILFDYFLVSVDLLAALVANSEASLRTLAIYCPTAAQQFPPLPSVQRLSPVDCGNAAFVEVASKCPALHTLTLPTESLDATSPREDALAHLYDEACVRALPPTLTRVDLPGVPFIEDLDTLLRALAPRGGRLTILGVDLPLERPYLRDAERAARQAHEREEALARKTLLEPLCAQRGIALVESYMGMVPDMAWTRS